MVDGVHTQKRMLNSKNATSGRVVVSGTKGGGVA